MTLTNEQDRAQVQEIAQQVQQITPEPMEVAFVDQGYTRETTAEATKTEGIRLEVVKLPQTRKGFVLLPRRWVVERSFTWSARFRRLARDYERLAETLVGFLLVAFAVLMLLQFAHLSAQSA